MAGNDPADDFVLIQLERHGTRSIGLDEPVDLRQPGREASRCATRVKRRCPAGGPEAGDRRFAGRSHGTFSGDPVSLSPSVSPSFP